MRATGYRRTGGPDVLELVELPVPRPGPGQVLIKVVFAGVNFAEIYYRRGAGHAPDPDGEPSVPGLEAAGHVVEVGAGVTGLRPGDPVAALTHAAAGATGGYAEYAVAPDELVYPLPRGVELSAAAALPCVLTTAYGLLTVAGLATGETVLVHGAAGGVGSAAVQVARALGAGTLIGTVGRPDKIEYARQLGYDQVFLRAEFADRIADLPGPGVDIALDGVGGPTRVRNLDVLAPLGRLVVFGDPGQGDDLAVSTNRLWFEAKAVLGFNIGELAAKTPSTVRRMALAALRLLADGRVDMAVAEVFPLDRAADAHRLLESGRSTGKILLAL